MGSRQYSVFVDTNVWIYYFMGKEPYCNDVVRMFRLLDERGSFVATNDLAAKDVFYLVPVLLKRSGEERGEGIGESSLNEVAWTCVEGMSKLAYMTNVGMPELMEARLFRGRHCDLEDNLMAASAEPFDFFVTYDKKLAKHLGRKAMSPAELVELLGYAQDSHCL